MSKLLLIQNEKLFFKDLDGLQTEIRAGSQSLGKP